MTRTLLVSLVTLGDPGRLTGGYLYHRRMAELAPEHGAELRFVSVPERPFPLPALAGRKVLRRALRPARSAPPATPAPWAAPADGADGADGPAGGGRADVVVLDSIAAAFLGPWLALERLPVPLVGSLHQPPGGIDHGPVRRAAQAPLDRLAYGRAALLLVASQALAEQVEAAGLPAGRILVVPPGRDVAAAPGAPAGDLRQGRRAALLCVANWIGRKGILETLEALARLDPGTATLHLAGDDRADPLYAAMVRARLSRPDLAGRVVVHGPLPVEAIAALYQAADVFVLPSVREPYGTVWGEAMAAGLPVVGWRAGNLPHLAGEGEALLVPPGDVEGLSRALALLAGDEPLRRRMGEAARRRASDRPTWRDSAARFFGALREAAQGPRGERR
jgi:glycosyltransferase involved in cell wall biosynthesis